MYALGGIDLQTLGFTAIRQDDSNIALSGFLDMPERLGKTFHDWANRAGVEPYVSASELFFGGRSLKLTGVITGTDQYDCNTKLAALVALVDSFTDLVPLATDWGTFQVYINDAIVGDYFGDTAIPITIPFKQPIVPITGTIPTGTGSEFGIDGISFAALGGTDLQLAGDRRNRPAPKDQKVTAYGFEGYQITKKQVATLNLKLAILKPTYAEMKACVDNLMALLAAPGLRSLTVNNDKLRSFFVISGFQVSSINVEDTRAYCVIDCKLTESGVAVAFANLVNSLGDIIIDNTNNIITVRI